jgi:5-methyltetrahydrofolate--homocysteine methyltransferase
MAEVLKEIVAKLYAGDDRAVSELVKSGLAKGVSASDLLTNGLMAGMEAVGRDFKNGDLFVPDVLVAARAMNAGMDLLRPLLIHGEAGLRGKIVMGTVEGDIHDIGKNLVKMMMQGAGFEVIDLGSDVSPAAFVASVQQHKASLLGMSALLTTTMLGMKDTVDALKAAGLRQTVKVMVGGAPVTQEYADEIGADGYAPDSASAVDVAKALTI